MGAYLRRDRAAGTLAGGGQQMLAIGRTLMGYGSGRHEASRDFGRVDPGGPLPAPVQPRA